MRRRDCGARQARAHVRLVPPRWLEHGALAAWPAEVPNAGPVRVDRVDLLPGAPAHIADPQRLGNGMNGHPEGIAQPVGHDPLAVRGRLLVEARIVGAGRRARDRAHANDGTAQAERITGRPDVLRAEPAPLTRRLAIVRFARIERITTRILWRRRRQFVTAPLAPVGGVEVRPVAAAHDQGAFRVEDDVAHGVAGVLLAPVLDQHALAGAVGQNRQAAAHDATVLGAAGWFGAPVTPARRRAADERIVRVGEVHAAVVDEVGVERHPQEPAVPVVVDLCRDVGVDARASGRSRLEKTLMTPRFSATKTRPSGANSTTIG